MIKQIENKYSWLKLIDKKAFILNGEEIINKEISLKELGLNDDSNIIIQIQ